MPPCLYAVSMGGAIRLSNIELLHSHKRYQYMRILELYSKGYSTQKCADTLKCDVEFVASCLSDLNAQAREELKDLVLSEVPLQFKSSILLLREVIGNASEICDKLKDGDQRIVLQARALQVSCLNDINKLMADSLRISSTLSRLERKQVGSSRQETDIEEGEGYTSEGQPAGEEADSSESASNEETI